MKQRLNRFKRLLDTKMMEQNLMLAELDKLQAELRRMEEEEKRLKSEYETCLANFCGSSGKPVTVEDLWLERQSVAYSSRLCAQMSKKKDAMFQSIDECKQRVLEKHKETKIMDTLIEKLKIEIHEIELSIEQKQLDDIALQKYLRTAERRG